MTWDAQRYDASFSVITTSGGGVVDLLDPRPGEQVLDLGCGTGWLTAEIAARGAAVIGIDADIAMVAGARKQHPALDFRIADGHTFQVDAPVDAVFSNAALHWMTRPDDVLAAVRRALRTGGRFIGEMGAAGNITRIISAIRAARGELGHDPDVPLPWYFPTPGEYATRLERSGFEVRLLACFDRPTSLDDSGIAGWVRMFGAGFTADLTPEERERVSQRADELARPHLWDENGWHADYRRLRFAAVAAKT